MMESLLSKRQWEIKVGFFVCDSGEETVLSKGTTEYDSCTLLLKSQEIYL